MVEEQGERDTRTNGPEGASGDISEGFQPRLDLTKVGFVQVGSSPEWSQPRLEPNPAQFASSPGWSKLKLILDQVSSSSGWSQLSQNLCEMFLSRTNFF